MNGLVLARRLGDDVETTGLIQQANVAQLEHLVLDKHVS